MKSFQATAIIDAPRSTIWSLLTDAPAYPSWNTTVEQVEGRIAAGESITVRVRDRAGRSFPVRVTTFAAEERMVWEGGMPLGLFKGERTFTLAEEAAGVRFTMRETYTGPLAPLVGRSIPDLQPAFEAFAASLKRAAETSRGSA